jgi:hypothetical protein
MTRQPIPLLQRPGDIALLLFFFISLFYVALIIDIEQLMIADPSNFEYPIWPPAVLVDHVHWYGRTFDPLQMARPAWWRACILYEMFFFVPFYPFAIYAFIRGREWIRIPALLYGASLFTIVFIILNEERFGPHAAPNFSAVFAFNLPWLLAPAYLIYRMWRYPHPFTRLAGPSS